MQTTFHQRVSLDLAYDVRFTRDLFAPGNDTLGETFSRHPVRRLLICLDAGVAVAWPGLVDRMQRWFEIHGDAPPLVHVEVVPGGEAIKNDPAVVDRLGELFLKHGLCRHSAVLAVGGGAVLDAVGFAASITHRGLKLFRAPTTVLSQNDSGVGVKNGVNRFGKKNFYGVFAPPSAVLCDFDLLATLDDRTWHSGVSEAFKVGLIKDRAFLDFLVANTAALRAREAGVAETMIVRAAVLHMDHIRAGGDPFEQGSSRPLDFGHWSAHKLESLTRFELLHGEAVAIGIALDLQYAALLGFLPATEATRLSLAMRDAGLPIDHPYLRERFDALLDGLDEFREHLGGCLTLAMPRPLGGQVDIHEVDVALLREAVARVHAVALAAEAADKPGVAAGRTSCCRTVMSTTAHV